MPPSQVTVTADNRGPLINLANWLTLAVVCLAAFTKVGTKVGRIGTIQKDDVYMLAAMLAAVGNSVAVSVQVAAGLGRHMDSLTAAQIESFEKATYAAQMLYILSLCLAKLALLHVYTTIARVHLRLSIVRGIIVFNVLWALVAVFAIAFQCHLPRPWAIIMSDQCFDQAGFWAAIGAFDILIDLFITVLPTWLLYDVQLPWRKKIFVIIAFTGRILVIPLAILRLVYISSASHTVDRTFFDFNTVLTTTIDVNLSIIIACVPFLKPFVDSLQVGLFNSDPRILVPTQRPHGNGYDTNWWSKNGKVSASDRFRLGSRQWLSTGNNNNQTVSQGVADQNRSQRALNTIKPTV